MEKPRKHASIVWKNGENMVPFPGKPGPRHPLRRVTLHALRQHPVALALGAGGARGWAHLGIWQALLERDIHPVAIAGTSMGALVGAFLAADRYDALLDIARSIDTVAKSLALFLEFSVTSTGLTQARRVVKLLASNLPPEFADLRLPFACIATDLRTAAPVTLSAGPLVPSIRASISIPGLFTPVDIPPHRLLVDGGLVDPVPVSAARALAPNATVIAVDVTADTSAPCSAEALLRPSYPLVPHSAIPTLAIRSLQIVETQVGLATLRATPPDLLAVPPVGHIATLDFHRSAEAIRLGHDTLASLLDALPP